MALDIFRNVASDAGPDGLSPDADLKSAIRLNEEWTSDMAQSQRMTQNVHLSNALKRNLQLCACWLPERFAKLDFESRCREVESAARDWLEDRSRWVQGRKNLGGYWWFPKAPSRFDFGMTPIFRDADVLVLQITSVSTISQPR